MNLARRPGHDRHEVRMRDGALRRVHLSSGRRSGARVHHADLGYRRQEDHHHRGARSGNIDPGVIFHLMREQRMNLDAIEDLLYRRAGLLGMSGVPSDLRERLASDAAPARLAVDYFVYRIVREIGPWQPRWVARRHRVHRGRRREQRRNPRAGLRGLGLAGIARRPSSQCLRGGRGGRCARMVVPPRRSCR